MPNKSSAEHYDAAEKLLEEAADRHERGSTDLESVLGATPREFESRILRHCEQRAWRVPPLGMSGSSAAQIPKPSPPAWRQRAEPSLQ
jgi:hypothetical protein